MKKLKKGDMMESFNWEEFKLENIGVYCPTETEFKDFLKNCVLNGMRFNKEDFDFWRQFGDKVHYYVYDKTYNEVDCSHVFYCEENNYQIIEWKNNQK